MRFRLIFLLASFAATTWITAGTLPVIIAQPQNLTNAGTFMVIAENASSIQWRCNGVDILGATNASLVRSGTDLAGYYMVIVKNDTGWVPSQLAYLFRGSGGYVPFSNYGNPAYLAAARYDYYGGMGQAGQLITNGTAQIVAGPELDQMQPAGALWDFSWYSDDPSWAGYFDMPDQRVPSVSPGQTVYYRVDLTYPTPTGNHTQPSSTVKLIAGNGLSPAPLATSLGFPFYIEWPTPEYEGGTPTNRVQVPGETCTLSAQYLDYGVPSVQWRKDGIVIPGATSFVTNYSDYAISICTAMLTVTNVQASDAGLYDVEVFGNQWILTPGIALGVQWTNGPGLFVSPRLSPTNFASDFLGAAGRSYQIQSSADLVTWNNLQTLTNATGSAAFSTFLSQDAVRFYRSRLLP